MKIYQVVQKLLVGDRETGDLISLSSFLESRLKLYGNIYALIKAFTHTAFVAREFYKFISAGTLILYI
jgi:hypothetical protein